MKLPSLMSSGATPRALIFSGHLGDLAPEVADAGPVEELDCRRSRSRAGTPQS